ncbi:urease accessory protein [Microbulbifer rhizosphaerae]|uniref:Urease accessory protein UreD n=1 Tax=Microbulbifer rhizosphaerae TaxID=1562603 RepID=A0A7W4Z8L0_9GAMM|nr:urease accessory protein [Microbulbifer rhizosphaerae]
MDSRWYAGLDLRFQESGGGCRLAHSRHRGPLYVQKPFYPEGRDLAHVYLLHPPGGLVSGDQLNIQVQAETGARALVTTTGAGRVYRARGDGLKQCQEVRLRLAAGSSLEWLPLENIVYPGADGRLDTVVELTGESRFAGWEITSLGLPACGESFGAGALTQRLEIRRDGLPLFVERLDLDQNGAGADLLSAAAGLRGFPVTGLLVMGPFARAPDESVLAQCRTLLRETAPDCLGAITAVGEFQVVRCLGRCAFAVRQLLARLWALLRPPLLGREACPPRIWST